MLHNVWQQPVGARWESAADGVAALARAMQNPLRLKGGWQGVPPHPQARGKGAGPGTHDLGHPAERRSA